MARVKKRQEAILLAEYSAANDVYLAYDGFRWQSGSFLVAGVFVFWGLISQVQWTDGLILVTTVLVAIMMALWLLFAHHYRQLYLLKLNRIHEIERLLGMEQHLRFLPSEGVSRRYRSFGPRGHHLDAAVFVVTSLGGGLLAVARNGLSLAAFAAVPIVVAALLIVVVNERRMSIQREAPTESVETKRD